MLEVLIVLLLIPIFTEIVLPIVAIVLLNITRAIVWLNGDDIE